MPTTFDPCVRPGGRFRDVKSGQFVARARIIDAMHARVDTAQDYAAAITDSLRAGNISIGEWQSLMGAQIRLLYVELGMLGKGGKISMSQKNFGQLGSQIKEQYGYLNRFGKELENAPKDQWGKIISGRPGMYMSAPREAFYLMQREGMAECGKVGRERRVSSGDRGVCSPCESLAGLGWQPLGTLPLPGNSPCVALSRCRCDLQLGWESA